MKDIIKDCKDTKITISEMVLPNHTNNLDTLFAQELDIDFAKDSIYSEKLVIFSNVEGRISGTKLKANSNFTFFQLSDVSEGHVNYDME